MNEEKMVCSLTSMLIPIIISYALLLNLFRSFNSVVETKANIHVKDDNIGMNAQISLSWKFYIINDLTMFARCGNQQHEMNTNNWVWNAQIIYNFIKGWFYKLPPYYCE